jgi:hypothetical protein
VLGGAWASRTSACGPSTTASVIRCGGRRDPAGGRRGSPPGSRPSRCQSTQLVASLVVLAVHGASQVQARRGADRGGDALYSAPRLAMVCRAQDAVEPAGGRARVVLLREPTLGRSCLCGWSSCLPCCSWGQLIHEAQDRGWRCRRRRERCRDGIGDEPALVAASALVIAARDTWWLAGHAGDG